MMNSWVRETIYTALMTGDVGFVDWDVVGIHQLAQNTTEYYYEDVDVALKEPMIWYLEMYNNDEDLVFEVGDKAPMLEFYTYMANDLVKRSSICIFFTNYLHLFHK